MSGSRKAVNPFPPGSDPRDDPRDDHRPEEREGTLPGTLLGGRVRYAQFAAGYRTGLEPVLMAAAVPAKPGETVLEGGCGAGAALLCLSARVAGISGVGLEADEATRALAARNFEENAPENGESPLEAITARLPDIPAGLRDRLAGGRFDHVMANPPWHDPRGTPSPDGRRRLALHAEESDPAGWIRALSKWVRPGGTLTVVLSAAGTGDACAAMRESGCGSIRLFPFWPRAGREAKLVLIQAVFGGRGAFRLLPGLTLHEADGRFTPAAERVLRGGEALKPG